MAHTVMLNKFGYPSQREREREREREKREKRKDLRGKLRYVACESKKIKRKMKSLKDKIACKF